MSPPGIDFDVATQPSDIEDTPPPVMRRAAPHQDVDSLPEKQVQSPNDGINSGRLKSIIVTPTDGRSEEQEEAREVVEIADDEETLLQFQSKKKKRNILFLIETKNNSEMVLDTLKWLPIENHHAVPPQTPGGGGLFLIWKKDIDLTVRTSTKNFIDTVI
ncbi:unnamed protein product, partial [Brassica oleracea var. botrytis]